MWYSKLALILTIIGGLNWGLIGVFDFNLVTFLFGASILTPITYIIIGLASLFCIYYSFSTTEIVIKK